MPKGAGIVINSFRGLSVTEYARLAFGGTRDPYELEQAIRGLHRTAPSESASFRHWLKAYLQTGYHPLDVITYESRTASWEERLACRDTLVLAIRQGRVSPEMFRVLTILANPYDRVIFEEARADLRAWAYGDTACDPTHPRRNLLRMAAGIGGDHW
jgi:hypothetical protein